MNDIWVADIRCDCQILNYAVREGISIRCSCGALIQLVSLVRKEAIYPDADGRSATITRVYKLDNWRSEHGQ